MDFDDFGDSDAFFDNLSDNGGQDENNSIGNANKQDKNADNDALKPEYVDKFKCLSQASKLQKDGDSKSDTKSQEEISVTLYAIKKDKHNVFLTLFLSIIIGIALGSVCYIALSVEGDAKNENIYSDSLSALTPTVGNLIFNNTAAISCSAVNSNSCSSFKFSGESIYFSPSLSNYKDDVNIKISKSDNSLFVYNLAVDGPIQTQNLRVSGTKLDFNRPFLNTKADLQITGTLQAGAAIIGDRVFRNDTDNFNTQTSVHDGFFTESCSYFVSGSTSTSNAWDKLKEATNFGTGIIDASAGPGILAVLKKITDGETIKFIVTVRDMIRLDLNDRNLVLPALEDDNEYVSMTNFGPDLPYFEIQDKNGNTIYIAIGPDKIYQVSEDDVPEKDPNIYDFSGKPVLESIFSGGQVSFSFEGFDLHGLPIPGSWLFYSSALGTFSPKFMPPIGSSFIPHSSYMYYLNTTNGETKLELYDILITY